jgi:AcrR family transcriptional regulator
MAAKKAKATAPRGPGRLSAEATAKLEDRLIDAAEQVFLGQGYARATIDAIAKAAGVTRKTLYARYANKEEVFAAFVQRLIDTGIKIPERDAGAAAGGPRAQLMRLALDLVAFVDSPQLAGVNRLLFSEGHLTPDLARLSSDLYNKELDNVSAALAPLKESGVLPLMPEPRVAAVILIEATSSTARMRAMLDTKLPRKQVEGFVATAVDVFMRGCGWKGD